MGGVHCRAAWAAPGRRRRYRDGGGGQPDAAACAPSAGDAGRMAGVSTAVAADSDRDRYLPDCGGGELFVSHDATRFRVQGEQSTLPGTVGA
jgi:hypothetical protein